MNKYTYAQGTRQGGRNENQDYLGSAETKFGFLIAVCDGMGGAKGGSTASKLAIETIMSAVSNSNLTSATEILTDAIKKANEVIYNKSISTPDLQGMGTTVVAILINEECVTTAHVGDSRIYQIRHKRKVFRTFDHSMVFELVRRGRITEEQARLSAESNVILRALGTKPEVEVEINNCIPYQKGDRFLLCSDGISGAVTEPELCKLINASKSVEQTVETITETIDNIGINNGGRHDNLTVALVELNSNSKIKVKMERKSKIIIAILASLFIISCFFNGLFFVKYPKNEKALEDVKAIIDNSKIKDSVLRDTLKVTIENNNLKK